MIYHHYIIKIVNANKIPFKLVIIMTLDIVLIFCIATGPSRHFSTTLSHWHSSYNYLSMHFSYFNFSQIGLH